MKNMTRSILLAWTVFAACAIYGGQSPGVAGVDVVVKQNPSKRTVTDSRGSFSLEGLPAGSYTLGFRAREAKDLTRTPEWRNPKVSTDKVTVATSYSIKIDGTKRSVSKSGLTSENVLAGVDVPVEVGAGAKVRGQVAAGALKKMVWIPKEPGSNIPGHWAAADSAEAKAKRSDTQTLSRDDLRELMSKGNPNQTDPTDPRNPPTSPLGAPR
jgi:hypothetical protein